MRELKLIESDGHYVVLLASSTFPKKMTDSLVILESSLVRQKEKWESMELWATFKLLGIENNELAIIFLCFFQRIT